MFILNVSAIGKDSPNEESNKAVTFIELASPEAVVVSNLNVQQEMKKLLVVGHGNINLAQAALNVFEQQTLSDMDVLLVSNLEAVEPITMELTARVIDVEVINPEPILKQSVSKYINPPKHNYRCR